MEFALSEQPAYGTWKIRANAFVSTSQITSFTSLNVER